MHTRAQHDPLPRRRPALPGPEHHQRQHDQADGHGGLDEHSVVRAGVDETGELAVDESVVGLEVAGLEELDDVGGVLAGGGGDGDGGADAARRAADRDERRADEDERRSGGQRRPHDHLATHLAPSEPRHHDEQGDAGQSVDELVAGVERQAQEHDRWSEHPPARPAQVEGAEGRQQHEGQEADEGLLDVPAHPSEVLGRDQQHRPAEQRDAGREAQLARQQEHAVAGQGDAHEDRAVVRGLGAPVPEGEGEQTR